MESSILRNIYLFGVILKSKNFYFRNETQGSDGHFWAKASVGDCVNILAIVNKTLYVSNFAIEYFMGILFDFMILFCSGF